MLLLKLHEPVKLLKIISKNLNLRMMASTSIDSVTTTAEASSVNNCLFCSVIKENEPSKILYQDEEIVAFADIKPVSKFHYLIVPKKHIIDAKHLTSADKSLVEKLVMVGKQVLEHQQADLNNIRFGFHWPPFHTISHLHLHAISPTSEMSYIGRLIFRPNSYWFVSPDYVLSRL